MSRQPILAAGIAVASLTFFGYACSGILEGEETSPTPEPRTGPIPEIVVEDIVEYSPNPIPDQVIECYDENEAVSEFTSYVVWDDKVWLNRADDRASRECVSEGTCDLGWYDGRLVHISRTPDLVRTELIDLEKLEMDVIVDMTSLFHGQDLEPQLQPIVPCHSRKLPLGMMVVPETSEALGSSN